MDTFESDEFAQGNCSFTGCTKRNRKQCWQYISVTKNFSCASRPSLESTLLPLPSPSPSNLLQLHSLTSTLSSPLSSAIIMLSQHPSYSLKHSLNSSPVQLTLSTPVMQTDSNAAVASSPAIISHLNTGDEVINKA